MSNELRRRAAFWRNMEYSLDQMLEEVISRSGDKWFNDDDSTASKVLSLHLGNSLNAVRMRFSDVLQSQITEWVDEQKVEACD